MTITEYFLSQATEGVYKALWDVFDPPHTGQYVLDQDEAVGKVCMTLHVHCRHSVTLFSYLSLSKPKGKRYCRCYYNLSQTIFQLSSKVLDGSSGYLAQELGLEIRMSQRGRSRFHMARETFYPQGYGMVLFSGAPFKEAFDRV